MSTGDLSIDLNAIKRNWKALDALSAPGVETGATVKANAYGLGSDRVSDALCAAGARTLFVAAVEEAAKVRRAVGPGPRIFVYSGHLPGDAQPMRGANAIPLLNSVEQVSLHLETLPEHPFGIQLDSGMNRLGIEPGDWAACRSLVLPLGPELVMTHLACSEDTGHAMNPRQLKAFGEMAQGVDAPLSIAATAGIVLGPEYHLDLVRPGIGLFGGQPFMEGEPVARLSIPVVQTRTLGRGETVGYGATWSAEEPARIATIAAGYADGIIRAGSNRATVYAGPVPCPVVGRVSMDVTTVDITHLDETPPALDVICPSQGFDELARELGTIGHEVLTSLGGRYTRTYTP